MTLIKKILPFATAIMVVVALFGSPSSASADPLNVRVYDDGVLQGGIFVLVSGNSLIFMGTTTHFSITNGSSLSNNPGTPGGSNLDLSANEQVNTTFGSTGGTHTIRIELSQTGWTAPNEASLLLSSSAGGSFAYQQGSNIYATQTVSASYRGFLDNTNTLFGQPAVGGTPLQTASSTLNSSGTSALVFTPDPSTNLVPGGVPFSMTNVLTFTFTLDPGSGQASANISTSSVATAVPEPTPLLLLGIGLIGFGMFGRRGFVLN